MFKATLTIVVLALMGLVALVSCQEHYPYSGSAGYASVPHGSDHHMTSQRLKHKLRSLKYDPKVQTGIQAIKPAVGYAAAVAQPVLNSALRKANDWSTRRARLGPGPHVGTHHGNYHVGSHLPYNGAAAAAAAHHSEFASHQQHHHQTAGVHY